MSQHHHTRRPADTPGPTDTTPGRSVTATGEALVQRTLRYTVGHRRAVLEGFFSDSLGIDSSGAGAHALGPGRALWEFQEWEIRSGRLDDLGGSPWWSIVNGFLVADLAAASEGAPGPWRDCLDAPHGERLPALWAAHQDSIGRGVAAARDRLADEPETERAFIDLALGAVQMAADAVVDTSRGSLGRQTDEIYPKSYPCTAAELERVRRGLGLRGGGHAQ